MSSRKRVSYFYQGDVGHFYYGPGHPMKPHRLKLTHNLVLNYGLYRQMQCFRPHAATHREMKQFHASDYVDFLKRVTPDNEKKYQTQLQKFSIGEQTDCPIFDGLFEFCQMYTGASLDAAARLNQGLSDICINWAGGLHHAKKAEASGFCYINDIVLAILELLKFHARVLYIDIDIHHGDGVEEAFYATDRVMTVSFHKFGDFFPGTGDVKDIGTKDGKYYAVNFPIKEGIDDENYVGIFKPIIKQVMAVYRPGAVVLQCGADSLTGDRLGCFNLTLKGHAECVKYVKSFGLPTLVLGGGGYTIRNVARCWTYETATLLGADISNSIPANDYLRYYSPDCNLHLKASDTPNQNTKEYLEKFKIEILENLRQLHGAPGVQMQHVPPSWLVAEFEETDSDKRMSAAERERKAEHASEFYDK